MRRRRTERLWILAALALVAGCGTTGHQDRAPKRPPDVSAVPDAVPRNEPRSKRGNPDSYEVFGKRYYVMDSASGHVERGVASWYGEKFHGRLTSSGEPYDMYLMTAAHKTLPLPAYAEVTNLGNGRSVVVKINDRGPFVGNRIIDLSYAAASRLDMLREGTAMVEIRVIEPGGNSARGSQTQTPAATTASAAGQGPSAGQMYVQLGAFAEDRNALSLAQRLRQQGVNDVLVREDQSGGRPLYRVRVGPVSSVEYFDWVVQQASALGIDDAHLTPE